MSHWYDEYGNPMHKVKSADGKKMIKTTLRQARKLNLCPSVTTILSILDKPQLTRWMHEQITKTCLFEDFHYHIYEDLTPPEYHEHMIARALTKDAADLGTDIHKSIDQWFLHGFTYVQTEHHPYIGVVDEVFKQHNIKVRYTEKRFCSKEYGYAGCIDVVAEKDGQPYIVDFKTCKNIPDKPYDGQPEQIAAYFKGHFLSQPFAGMNLYLSTTEAGVYKAHAYDKEELEKAWKEFQWTSEIWFSKKNYDPRKG